MRRKEELVLNGGELDTEDPSEEERELLRKRDDRTVLRYTSRSVKFNGIVSRPGSIAQRR